MRNDISAKVEAAAELHFPFQSCYFCIISHIMTILRDQIWVLYKTEAKTIYYGLKVLLCASILLRNLNIVIQKIKFSKDNNSGTVTVFHACTHELEIISAFTQTLNKLTKKHGTQISVLNVIRMFIYSTFPKLSKFDTKK